jgi:hypothetical protein
MKEGNDPNKKGVMVWWLAIDCVCDGSVCLDRSLVVVVECDREKKKKRKIRGGGGRGVVMMSSHRTGNRPDRTSEIKSWNSRRYSTTLILHLQASWTTEERI